MGRGQQHRPRTNGTGSDTGSGTGTGATSGDTAVAAAPTLDAGAATLLGDYSEREATYLPDFFEVTGLARQADLAQDAGDVAGWYGSIDLLLEQTPDLDWFLPSHPGILQQLRWHGEDHPELTQVPEFREGYLRAYQFGLAAQQQRALIQWLMVPTKVHGETIGVLPKLPLDSLSYTEMVEGQAQALAPLLEAATEIRQTLAGAADASGARASSLATAVVAGPMGDFVPGSPEAEYLRVVVKHSQASAELRNRVTWLLGADDFDAYEGVFGTANANSLFEEFGRGEAAGLSTSTDQAAATLYSPGFDVNAENLAAKGKTGFTGFDSSKIPGPAEPEKDPNEKPLPKDISERGMERRQITLDPTGKFVVGQGTIGVEGGLTRKRTGVETKDGKDVVSKDGSSVGVDGSLTAGDQLSGHLGAKGKRSFGDGSTVAGNAKVGRDDKGGWSAEAGGSYEIKNEDGSGAAVGKTFGYDQEKGFKIGADASHTRKMDDGTSRTTGGNASISQDGSFAVGGRRNDELANGDKRGTAVNGSYDAASGEMGVSFKRSNTDKDDNDKGSFGGSFAVDGDGKDGKTGVKGSVSASKGGKSVAISGGRTVEVQKPVLKDGRWVVTYAVDTSASLSGGAEKKGKGSINGNIGGGATKGGSRSFATEAEANAFFAHPQIEGLPVGADDALAMAKGDSRSEGDHFEMGLGGTAQIGMVQVGAGYQHKDEHGETVTRGEGGRIQVEVANSKLDGIQGSLGAGGVSMGIGRSWASQSSWTVEFDLDRPEGRQAYDHWQRFKALPRVARGWRVIATAQGEAQTDTRTLGLLGIQVGSGHTVAHSEEHRDGHKFERDRGTDSMSVSIPLLGSYNRTHSLSMLQVDDKQSFYNVESTVKGSDLDDVQAGLGRSAMETEEGSQGSNKGTYRLQSAISESDMDRFIATAKRASSGDFIRAGGLHGDAGFDDLQSGLRAAGNDKDAQRRVMARWVADEGYEALTTLHAMTGGRIDGAYGGGSQLYVAIDGDPYMDGLKGQLDQEIRIKRWNDRLADGERGAAMATEIRRDLVFQREKSRHLETCGELPYRVYHQEYDRVRQNIVLLDQLLQRSLTADGAPDSGTELDDTRFLAFQRASATLSGARAACDKAYEWVYIKHEIDHRGAFVWAGKQAAKELTDERLAYDEAQGLYRDGLRARELAMVSESLSNRKLTPDTVTAATAMVIKARSEYLRSERFFREADEAYHQIHLRNLRRGPRSDYRGERFLPGQ